jgi:hypothetical protein
MNKFWRFAPWFTRIILLPPTFIFAMIASRYLVDPVHAGAAVGLAFTTPLALTITRVGFGAFPLGCSLFTLSCLISTRRLLTGLGFVATMIGVALVVRIFGMLADGTVRENMRLVGAEVVLLAFLTVGFFIESARRNHLKQSA